MTLLAEIQDVHTSERCTEPWKLIFRRCKFGKTWRNDLPTTLEPAPPFFFSIPRRLYFLPLVGPLPHTIQNLMSVSLGYRLLKKA